MSKAEVLNENGADGNNLADNQETGDAMDTEVEGADKDPKTATDGEGGGGEPKPDAPNDTRGLRRDSGDEKDIGPGGSVKSDSTSLKVHSAGGFKIRPDLSEKFRPGVVQSVIEKTLKEFLEGKSYSAEESPQWTRSITNAIHSKIRGLDYKRYKLVTFVVLGEYRGGGITVSNRCLWDADSDCKATYKFINDSLFCVGSVYGFYFY